MRLYFAAAVGSGIEDLLADRGGRSRLLSFDDTGPSATQARTFWIRARREAMRLYAATNVVDSPDDTARTGARSILGSFAYAGSDGWQAKQDRWTDWWLGGRREAMRLYVAGNAVHGDSEQQMRETGLGNRLVTFADVDDWARRSFAYWVENRPQDVHVFLDSGAFGAYTRGAVIDLDRYCAYIAEYRDALECYAALDVIGDWRASARNLDAMLARGLDPIPCFHRGSPYEELDRLARDHKYLALGGLVGGEGKRGMLTPDAVQPHLDACWRVLERRWPVKVHVFGVLAQWVLERYPFYSADSATAIMGAGMGRVQAFLDGEIVSDGWREICRRDMDGTIMDGVGAKGSAHNGRKVFNVRAQLAYERYLTDLWAARGVSWNG